MCPLSLGDTQRAEALAHECLGLARQIDDGAGIVISLHRLCLQTLHRGDYAQAEEYLRQGLVIAQRLVKPWFTYMLTLDQGFVAAAQGQYELAAACFTQTLTMARAAHDKFFIFYALDNLSTSIITPANYAQSKAIAEECLALQHEIGGKRGLALALLQLARIASYEGNLTVACQHARDAVSLTYEIGDPRCLTTSLFELAALYQSGGAIVCAAQLLAAICNAFQQTGLGTEQHWQQRYENLASTLHSQLGDEGFDRACSDGKAMSLIAAARYALLTHDQS